jgi:hypothetical protein
MSKELNMNDVNFILESLNYTKLKFEGYEYPSYEFKQKRLKDVNDIIEKVKSLKEELKV